jgi:desulfoferrodoxin (superoxide reductase-like protein)
MKMIRVIYRVFTLLSFLAFSVAQVASGEQHSLEDTVHQLQLEHTDTLNSQGDATKHTPVVQITSENLSHITIPHEMNPTKPHWIQYLWALDETANNDNRILGVKAFEARQDPIATLTVKVSPGSTVRAFAFCNTPHGLWASDAFDVPLSGSDAEL